MGLPTPAVATRLAKAGLGGAKKAAMKLGMKEGGSGNESRRKQCGKVCKFC